MNIEAIIGLAISTAFLRSGFGNSSSALDVEQEEDVEQEDAWDDIAELARDYLKWANIDISEIELDKYDIAESIWGMSPEDLDEQLAVE